LLLFLSNKLFGEIKNELSIQMKGRFLPNSRALNFKHSFC